MSNINSVNFSKLLMEGLRVIFGNEYKNYPELYSKYFDVQISKKSSEESLSMSGLPMLLDKPKGSSVSYQSFQQGIVNTATHTTKGVGCIIERELIDDDLYNKINMVPKMMFRSTHYRVETDGANVLNNGFSSSYPFADGKALFATDHPTLNNGTYKNTLSTQADLSETSFEQALIDISDLVDNNGMIFNATGNLLIVRQENKYSADQLLGSEKVPESNFNAKNPANGVMPYLVNNFLTDPDAWFIRTDVLNGLTFYWKEKPELTYDNDFDSRDKKIKTVCRYTQTCHDPRGIFGSSGSGA